MKWTQQNPLQCNMPAAKINIHIPEGLIGMPEFKNFEAIIEKDMPFIELRSLDEKHIGFWALDPFPFVSNYEMDISDKDTQFLKIAKPQDALILTLATISKSSVTLNLMAPLCINKESQTGKQVVLENYKLFSPRHLIYEGSTTCLS